MADDFKFIMRVAIALIVLGLIAIGIADHWNWRDLAGAGSIVLGYGGGILQGKGSTQHNDTKTGDVINVTPDPKP